MRSTALRYNCFAWEGKFYVALCLLFGNGLGPYFFTKAGRPILGFFRTLCIACTAYIDDFLAAPRPEDSQLVGELVISVLTMLGWVVSPKSDIARTCAKVFTGILVDSEAMTYTYPAVKVDKFRTLLRSALAIHERARAVPYNLLYKIEGTMSAMYLAIPPIMLWVRDISVIRTRGHPDDNILLAEQEVVRLREIEGIIDAHNGAPIRPLRADIVAHVDAGGVGLGAKMLQPRGAPLTPPVELAEALTEEQMSESSTLRELLALLMLLQRHGQECRGRVLRVYFDSANAVRNLVKGGTTKNTRQHQLCKDIHALCTQWLITLQADWVPRDCNARADTLSKLFDRGLLSPKALKLLRATFRGAHIVTPVFTNVTHGLIAAARDHKYLAVVAPKWRTQVWWPTLMTLAKKAGANILHLGRFTDTFLSTTGHAPPNGWKFVGVLVRARDVQAAFGKPRTIH